MIALTQMALNDVRAGLRKTWMALEGARLCWIQLRGMRKDVCRIAGHLTGGYRCIELVCTGLLGIGLGCVGQGLLGYA